MALPTGLELRDVVVLGEGFAQRRNGSCMGQQVNCGATAAPYYACCPLAFACPSTPNAVCCRSRDNCTAALAAKPRCANPTWDLYDNGGFFCCQRDHRGYAAGGGKSDGCADPGYNVAKGEVWLDVVTAGQAGGSDDGDAGTTSTAVSSAAATATPTAAAAEPAPASKVGLGVGLGVGVPVALAIVGALAFLLWRRRRAARQNRLEPETDKVGVDYAPLPPNNAGILRPTDTSQ